MSHRCFAPRHSKAFKIRRILADYYQDEDWSGRRCLDIGCGNGEITDSLAESVDQMIGVEFDYALIQKGTGRDDGTTYLQADGTRLPFSSATLDLVICAQVYEHMQDAGWLPQEIERVLRPGGLCFFSGPNKVWPIEPHYGLPFLHWLPERFASFYLRTLGRGTVFDIRPYTYWRLRRAWSRFTCLDFTLRILRSPDNYGVRVPLAEVMRQMPEAVLKVLYFLLPNYNWLLVKPNAEDSP